MRIASAASALAAACALAGALPAGGSEIGSVAAVNRDVEGTPPDAPTRSLLIGNRVIADERIVSSEIGSGQLLFLDQTTLTVAPNSEIRLDRYIYDPATERGEIGLTVTRGALRMIGGRITKTSDATIRTPTATIGVRGGIAVVTVGPEGTRVMHVAGEYTRVTGAGGETLNLTRSNALATVGEGGAPEYRGVATEADVAGVYDSMQGGGGGREEPLEVAAVDGSGVAGAASEEPEAVTAPPISTLGERPAADNSVEVEQETVATTPDVQPPQPDEPIEPEPPVEPENPFAGFTGGALFVGREPFTDDAGQVVSELAKRNLVAAGEGVLATSITAGSIRMTFETGESVSLPLPEDGGFFEVLAPDTQTSGGRVTGGGFHDPDAGVVLFGLRERDGGIGAIFAGLPGPTQLRPLNEGGTTFLATRFDILPDLLISPNGKGQPFLPDGLDSEFDTGPLAQLVLVSPPGRPLFGPGAGPASDAGARFALPQFAVIGTGPTQGFLLSVTTGAVFNNGDGSPAFGGVGAGAFRLGGDTRAATRIQPHFGTIGIGPDGGRQRTVFGSGDNYLLLSNESRFVHDLDPEAEVVASFLDNAADRTFETYGNAHLARRAEDEALAAGDRIGIAATRSEVFQEFVARGLLDASIHNLGEELFLTSGYSAVTATFIDATGDTDKVAFRTVETGGGSAAANYSNVLPQGSIVVELNDVGEDVGERFDRVTLGFGGPRSLVVDRERFAMRDHPDPRALDGVLALQPANTVRTPTGEAFGVADGPEGQRAFRGAILGSGFADVASLYPAGTLLRPLHLQWGWWTGQYRFSAADPVEVRDGVLQFSLGTWVAGDRTNVLPPSGVATFNGPVTVHAIQNGTEFVDGGRFRLTWDFGARGGAARFENVLALPTFVVPVNEPSFSQGDHYHGVTSLPGNAGSGVAQVNGSFFDGPNANDARATAGSLRIDAASGSITAMGTFWGER